MAIVSRYMKVVETDGSNMTVRTALSLINDVLDQLLAEQENDFDADTRWATTWFEQHGMAEGPFGDAEQLSKAKNTSVAGLERAGLVSSRGGRVRLLRRDELPLDWDPLRDQRLTVWEVTQHLVLRLGEGGEDAAADLLRKVGGFGDVARELAYRLYALCERRGWSEEALAYNALVTSWPEVAQLAVAPAANVQTSLPG
jgi:putative DNA methylase